MMRNETLRNDLTERTLDSEELFELSDRELWERIYGRNAKPFDWRKSSIEIESPLRGY